MKKEIYYTSSNGVDKIYASIWECQNPKFILQIAHGMSEHIDRYEDLALFLNKHDVILAGNNHLGHGKTARKLGYFGKDSNLENIILDIEKLSEILKANYKLDIYYLGHSMGSFVMRYFISKYHVEKCILMGTGHINNFSGRLLGFLTNFIGVFKGDKYVSKTLLNMTTGSYSNKISEGMFDWISYNKNNVRHYIMDVFCGHPFTINGYKILSDLILKMNAPEAFENPNENIKLLFLSGADDVVGSSTKGVKKVFNKYKKAGFKNLKINIYKGMRHEILNEDKRELVYDRILDFLNEN